MTLCTLPPTPPKRSTCTYMYTKMYVGTHAYLTLQVMCVKHMYSVANSTPHAVLDRSHGSDRDVLLLTQGHQLIVIPIPLTVCSRNKPQPPNINKT